MRSPQHIDGAAPAAPALHPARVVRFSDASELILVPSLSASPFRHSLWYTRDELDGFKSNMTARIKLIRLHIAKRRAPPAEHILGLEKFLTLQLTKEYKARRCELTEAVMREARFQRWAGALDFERMATAASEQSKWARERARAAALFLEEDEARALRKDTQTTMTSRDCNHQGVTSHRQYARRASVQETKRSRTMTIESCHPEGSVHGC